MLFLYGVLASSAAMILTNLITEFIRFRKLSIILRQDEHVVCKSATIIETDKGEFSGWIDNEYL